MAFPCHSGGDNTRPNGHCRNYQKYTAGPDITQEMSTALGQSSSSQPQDAHVLGPDLSTMSPDAGTSVLPLPGPSSLNSALPGTDRMSGNKRKQEGDDDDDDDDDPSNGEDKSRDRKKSKHEAEGLDDGTSSFTVQDAVSLVTVWDASPLASLLTCNAGIAVVT